MKKLILFTMGVLFYAGSVFAAEAKHQTKHEPTGLAPEKSLSILAEGNERFLAGKVRTDGQSKEDVKKLVAGQKPHTIVLSCSDSRVPPELIFDQKLGEIFTVRTAGEALDNNVIGSIEYAVEHLGSRLILVLGHTSCGAVKAAHGTMNGSSAGTPALDSLVRGIHPHLFDFKNMKPSEGFSQEAIAHAKATATDLLERSNLIKESWMKGNVWMVYGLYNMETGTVKFFNNFMSPSDAKRGLASSEEKAEPAHETVAAPAAVTATPPATKPESVQTAVKTEPVAAVKEEKIHKSEKIQKETPVKRQPYSRKTTEVKSETEGSRKHIH
jgi:carbonic anhydrase